jgi:sigma-E factor negative regulatory protein RseA
VNTVIDMNTPRMDQETISALMDGQLRDAEWAAALRGMEAGDARQSWLIYHLAGDVLRSADLAHGRHDLRFAERVGQRLGAQETPAEQPPALAPDASRPAANDGVFRWRVAAGLASLAAVAAIGWGVLGGGGGPAASVGPQLAQLSGVPASGVALPEAQAVSSARAAGSAAQVASLGGEPAPVASAAAKPVEQAPVMLRDPRLDELLAAHRAAAGGSALDNSAGFLRNATFQGVGH